MKMTTSTALYEIIKERDRQEFLKAEGRFKYTCADPQMSMQDCMLVLMEEVGEMCRAVLEHDHMTYDRNQFLTDDQLAARMRDESTQVAAVALAIRERFVEIKDAE